MSKNKTSKLGSNPLDHLSWVAKDKNTDTEVSKKSKSKKTEALEKKEKAPEEKRETFQIKVELSEKIKNYAYWERLKQKEALNLIIEEFFKDKTVKPRLEK